LLAFCRVVLQDEIDPASVPTSQKNVICGDPKQVWRKALAHSESGEVASGVFKVLDCGGQVHKVFTEAISQPLYSWGTG
jgi:hypothetical protein